MLRLQKFIRDHEQGQFLGNSGNIDGAKLPLHDKKHRDHKGELKMASPPVEPPTERPSEQLDKVTKIVKSMLEGLRRKVQWNEQKSYLLSGIGKIENDKSSMADFSRFIMQTTSGPVLDNSWQRAYRKLRFL